MLYFGFLTDKKSLSSIRFLFKAKANCYSKNSYNSPATVTIQKCLSTNWWNKNCSLPFPTYQKSKTASSLSLRWSSNLSQESFWKSSLGSPSKFFKSKSLKLIWSNYIFSKQLVTQLSLSSILWENLIFSLCPVSKPSIT